MSGIIAQNVARTSGLVKAVAAGGGNWVEIKSITASADATIDFIDGSSDVVFDGTYPVYCFQFIQMHPATNEADFGWQATDDDSSHSFGIAVTNTVFRAYHNENDTATSVNYENSHDIAQSTGLSIVTKETGTNNADDSTSGYFYIFAPSNTTHVKHFFSESSTQVNESDPYSMHYFVGGIINTAADITGLQWKFSSGNMDSGQIKLFGIKDS